MQNFIITYKLRNPISGNHNFNLIVDEDLFQIQPQISAKVFEYTNHSHFEFEKGIEKCKELIEIIMKTFDIHKDINKLNSDKNHLMLFEIVVTVKFDENKSEYEGLTFKNDFKVFISDKNKTLENIEIPSYKILSGIRRRLSHFDWFDFIEKKICNQTYVYAIVNNRNTV
jgi:hypothetical protein